MADYPDVLDSMGKTPREFGALHVHFEALKPVDRGLYVASVLLQAAFEPMPTAAIDFISPTGETLLTVPVPSLDGGRVVRLHAPLRSRGPLERVGLKTDCPDAPRGAQRVRPAWKLLDTVEIPKLSDMQPSNIDTPSDAVNAFSRRSTARIVSGSDAMTTTLRTTVHKARELPSVLWVDLTPTNVAPLAEYEFEAVWSVGQRVPEAPPIVPIVRHEKSGERRWCRTCAWEAKPGEHLTARSCPNCDAPCF